MPVPVQVGSGEVCTSPGYLREQEVGQNHSSEEASEQWEQYVTQESTLRPAEFVERRVLTERKQDQTGCDDDTEHRTNAAWTDPAT